MPQLKQPGLGTVKEARIGVAAKKNTIKASARKAGNFTPCAERRTSSLQNTKQATAPEGDCLCLNWSNKNRETARTRREYLSCGGIGGSPRALTSQDRSKARRSVR